MMLVGHFEDFFIIKNLMPQAVSNSVTYPNPQSTLGTSSSLYVYRNDPKFSDR